MEWTDATDNWVLMSYVSGLWGTSTKELQAKKYSGFNNQQFQVLHL